MDDDSLGQWVVRPGLDGGGQRQHLLLSELTKRNYLGHARLALGQRAGFVEGDGADTANGFQRVAAFDQQPSTRRNRKTRGNR